MKGLKILMLVIALLNSNLSSSQDLIKETRVDSVSAFFNSGSFTLKNSNSITTKLSSLNKGFKYKVKLIAYTDTVGSLAFNIKLASNRLKAVSDLVNKVIKDPIIDSMNQNEKRRKKQPLDEELFRRVDIIVYKIETNFSYNTPINLHINFQSATDVLLGSSYESLDKLLFILKQDTTLKIQLGGHVCCRSDYEMSLKRAERVKKYLVKKGIEESRMSCVGFDNKVKLVEETTPANEAKNRRVEVTFIK